MPNPNTPAADSGGIAQRIDTWLWPADDGLSTARAFAVQCGRLVWAVGRDISAGQLTLRAMSLVYTTLLSLVPLLAISFSVLKGFGVHNQIEPFLLEVLAPLGERSNEIATTVVKFVDNTEVGVLGTLGVALLFYTVISLMQKIEGAFNDVWQITAQRSFSERLRDYIAVLVIGPVLVFASLGITATVASNEMIAPLVGSAPLGWAFETIGRLIPIAMVVAAFTCMYVFVPNTRVRVSAAFAGALVAGVLWNVASMAFANFMTRPSNITAIYSGFATPVLFMLWLYLGWMILLIGANIAFYRQRPEYLRGRQIANALTEAQRHAIGLEALREIGQAYYAGQGPPNVDTLARDTGVPTDVVVQLLDAFGKAGLIAATAEPVDGWLPSRPWEEASVHDAIEVMRNARPANVRDARPPTPSAPVTQVLQRLRAAQEDQLGSMSLREFTRPAPADQTTADQTTAEPPTLATGSPR